MIANTTKRTTLPQQKISSKKKNDEWHKNCADAFISMSRFNRTGAREDIRKLYDYYTGHIHDEDYSFVLSPYGKTRKQKFPARLRNYPIIKPVVDLLLGEKHKRPFNYSVINVNGDSVTEREAQIQSQMQAAMQEKFAGLVNQFTGGKMGDTPPPSALQPLEKSYQLISNNLRDSKAIIGQKALNYLAADLHLKHEFDKGFFDFLVTGEVYSHKTIYKSAIAYESLNPLNIDYDMDPDTEFIEDADWALIRQEMFPSSVLDRFSDLLSPEEVDRLENPKETNLDTLSLYASPQHEHYYDNDRNRMVEVITIYFKTFKKIGIRLYYSEETQSLEEEIVGEDYKVNRDAQESVDWEWVPEVRRVIVIDQDIYIGMGPIQNVRTSPDDPGQAKLPINGRRYMLRNTENTSIVKLGIPYQIQYNIYKYRLELAIAKSKDVIGLLDIDMIPKKWSMDKFMYYLEGTGIGWVSYNNENLKLSATHQQVMDLSIRTIGQYIELLESILSEWERVSGVSQQRQGQIGPYESVTGSQQAIIQSSHITEDYFKKYEKFEEKELQGLLDMSKIAWLGGKKGSYVMPDGTTEFLTIDPIEYALSDLGVFVKNSAHERDRLEFAKSLTQPMIQNGYKASDVLSILESDNFSEIKQKIRVAEENAQKLTEAAAQAEAESAQKAQAEDHIRDLEIEQAKIAYQYDKIDADILMKQMDIEAKSDGTTMTSEERSKMLAEIDQIKANIQESRARIKLDEQIRKDNKEIAIKKIAVDKIKANKPTTSNKSK